MCVCVCVSTAGEPDHGEVTDDDELSSAKLKPAPAPHPGPHPVSVEVLVREQHDLISGSRYSKTHITLPLSPLSPPLSPFPPLTTATNGSLEQDGGLPEHGPPNLPPPAHCHSCDMRQLHLAGLPNTSIISQLRRWITRLPSSRTYGVMCSSTENYCHSCSLCIYIYITVLIFIK